MCDCVSQIVMMWCVCHSVGENWDLSALNPCWPESEGWRRRRPGASWGGLWRSFQLLWRKVIHCLSAQWATESPWRSYMERAWSWAWSCWLPGTTGRERHTVNILFSSAERLTNAHIACVSRVLNRLQKNSSVSQHKSWCCVKLFIVLRSDETVENRCLVVGFPSHHHSAEVTLLSLWTESLRMCEHCCSF